MTLPGSGIGQSLMRRYWVFMPVLLAGLALAFSIAVRSSNELEQELHLLPVRAQILHLQPDYQLQRRFAGQVLARQDAEVGFELAGQISDVLVNDGDRVAKGQVLARLDTALLQTENKRLQALLEDNQARRQLNQSNMARQVKLQANGFTSQQRLDELNAERDSLQAAADALAAQLNNVQTRLAKASLRAPFDGVVAHRYADQGMVVGAGTPVFKLQQQGAMEVAVGLPVPFAAQLAVSQQVTVELRDRQLAAVVISIGADVNPVTNTVKVRLLLPEQAQGFNGDIVHLLLTETLAQPGFWVPAEAVAAGLRGRWVVYVLVPDEGAARVEARDVQIHTSTGGRMFVSGALTDGEQLVAAGVHRVVPGQRVSVLGQPGSATKLLGER